MIVKEIERAIGDAQFFDGIHHLAASRRRFHFTNAGGALNLRCRLRQ